MADKRIGDFATVEEARDSDLLLISSENNTYNITIAALKNALLNALVVELEEIRAELEELRQKIEDGSESGSTGEETGDAYAPLLTADRLTLLDSSGATLVFKEEQKWLKNIN